MKQSIIISSVSLCFILTIGCNNSDNKRETFSLNGTWQITDGKKDVIPSEFNRNITVPGLVTLARPAFINPAPKVPDRNIIDSNLDLFYHQQDNQRDVYWYHRTFNIAGNVPQVALLKVGKAMFGTRVYLNGTYVGEHLPCFTPGYFDLKKVLKTGQNELIISVGSSRNSLPQDMPDGFDYEKQRYISGIFDNVELILSNSPFISNIQVAPDIVKKEAKIRAQIKNNGNTITSKITFIIKEFNSGVVAGEYTTERISFEKNAEKTINIAVDIKNCTFWSPEDPFLYTLEVSTCSDNYQTRFGMRDLHFDSVSHKAILNGKQYFLRGTNITLYRFFEDPKCDSLPWNYKWVRKMHKKFKEDMFWNSYRNCIGFPPEEWYNIADEEGFMIQDEFPIWYGAPQWNKWTKNLNNDELAKEYREWMKERWNHPSVVIWDGSNETLLNRPSIDSAIAEVRTLDMSGRSWDNSYSTAREPGDIFESHPYHYGNPEFKLKDMTTASIIPHGNNSPNPGTGPVIINEYGWLWLNRDGSPTTLTKQLYENLLGKNSTPEERWELYARYTAAETEFWRCHREAAGVMHFTGLGYDRRDGQTSDNWTDVKNLIWEPQFYKYVRDSFSPIGLMIDFWDDSVKKDSRFSIRVTMINDLEKDWNGSIMLKLKKNDKVVLESSKEVKISGFGHNKTDFILDTKGLEGNFTIEVALNETPFGTIKSIRNFKI